MQESIAPKDESPRQFNPSRLGDLLELLDIKEVYYIDDYNKADPLPATVAGAKYLFGIGSMDDLVAYFYGKIDVNVPSEDEIGEQIYRIWEELSEEEQNDTANNVISAAGHQFNIKEYITNKRLQQIFPSELLKLITPDEWDETLPKLTGSYSDSGKVLLLFDQDLSGSNVDKYRTGTEKGEHLILAIKKSPIKNNSYCALITHTITDTSKELEGRNKVIAEMQNALTVRDFFALTKDRIKEPELLCDGIKKALLNGYCEEIKDKSRQIIEEAQKKAMEKIDGLDTYDFDHTVLRSSYSEGIWEMDTLFRISRNFFGEEVRKLMFDLGYPKKVNPFIKKAKSISDIRFNIDPTTVPYNQKFSLRHQDIYEGDIINKLHLPLENGDIFEVIEGKGKGFYILVGQECDLMMRTNPIGARSAKTATLLKIKSYSRNELDELILKFYATLRADSHFYSNKFRLDYFKDTTNDTGLVKLAESFTVDLDILDLCVFNSDGVANIDLSIEFDGDLVSTSWENRYLKIFERFRKSADYQDKIVPEIAKIDKEIRAQIKKRISINLAPIDELGVADNYSNRKFKFGIKRVMRLKTDGAKLLMERYYTHLSRTAEQHDFAFEEKFIREGIKAVKEEQVAGVSNLGGGVGAPTTDDTPEKLVQTNKIVNPSEDTEEISG